MTTRPPATRPAARFNVPVQSRARSKLSAFGATIVLLGLVGGVPAVLLLLAGPIQVPTTWPDRSTLTGPIGIEQVLAVLVVVVWLAWLQFLICVAVEVLAALRGGVLAAPVPLSGPSQRLARALVAAVLLAGTIVGQVSVAQAAVSSGPSGRSSQTVATAAPFADSDDVIVFNGDTPVHAETGQSAAARQLTARQAAAAEATARRAATIGMIGGESGSHILGHQGTAGIDKDELALDGHKVYEVEAPAGRHHDSLWGIAERHLGDGRRYQEIYRLNEGRPQPDGRTLHLARLIQPGWRLVMPEDAIGVPRYVADRSALTPETAPAAGTVQAEGSQAQPNRSEHDGGAVAPPPATTRPTTSRPTASRPASAESPAATQRAGAVPQAGAPSVAATGPRTVAPTRSVAPTKAAATPARSAVPPAAGVGTAHPSAAASQPAQQNRSQPTPVSGPVRAAVQPDSSVADPGRNDAQLVAAELLGAGLLAAALLGTLLVIRRRRGTAADPDPESVNTEVYLRAGADADRGALLDLALRSLPGSCRDTGNPLPQAYGAVVDDEGLDLLLTMAHPAAPPPWIATDEGLRWRLDYQDAQHLVADGESVYPLLASVGRDPQGRDALVNLGAAAGPVAVVGHPAMAAAVVRALALGLAGNPWSRGIEVLTSDLPSTLPAIAAGRLLPCSDARDLTDRLELGSGRMPRTGPIQILTGGPAPGSRPERVAIYGAPLSAPTAQRLQTLAGRRSDLAVVVTGELPGACWRLRVDDAGNLSCDELSLNVTANRLGDGSIERLHSLFMSATTSGSRPGLSPDLLPDTDRVAEADDVTWAQAETRVAVLGEVEVRAPGFIDPSRSALAAEIVAYLALHPSGAHPTVLAAAVWPRGVTGDVRDGTLDQVRTWLGPAPDGLPRIREGRDGRIRLSTDVPCDWDVLRTLVERAGQASDPSRERDLLIRALHLVRGPVVGGIIHGTYVWLPRTDLERRAEELIVGAADRLSQICLSEGDQVAVERAAAAGLRAAPTAQHLWRHILRAEHALGGPTRMVAATEHLRFVLTTSGVDLEPQTQALIEHLGDPSAAAAPRPGQPARQSRP
ncbi:MAG TPA: BTAD domain-containing putative transcriptional regulator [Kineosporiaceae bacterium]|nr:BTAD domain-containing putative transcriptional regulator [Kineosporiaceae bacterium]